MIEPREPPYEPAVAESLRKLMAGTDAEPLRLFRTIAHHPELLDRFRQIGTTMLRFGRLDALERETVIQHMTARSGAEYEHGVHVALFGVPGPPYSGRQELLIAMVDELHETSTLSDELRERLRAEWTEAELVELLCLCGFYKLVSYVCNAAALEPEAWAAA
jgi:4-carboxymuconolactone decarboxylase